MEELIRYSERRVRERLRSLPDGEFRTRGFLDHDGVENRVYTIDVRLEKDGDVLRFDMRDSSPQAPTYINCTEGALSARSSAAWRRSSAPGSPGTTGSSTRIEVIAPQGLIVNAKPPGRHRRGHDRPGLDDHERGQPRRLEAAGVLRRAPPPLGGGHPRDVRGAVQRRPKPARRAVRHAADRRPDRRRRRERGRRRDRPVGRAASRRGRTSPTSRPTRCTARCCSCFAASSPTPAATARIAGGARPGTAWTPHGVERLRNSVTSHGVEVPVSFGQFGGMAGRLQPPAHRAGQRSVRELYAAGELPLAPDDMLAPIDLERLGGEVEVLEAKVPEFELVPGDVVLYTWQGGGGYGDPLERDPARWSATSSWASSRPARARRCTACPATATRCAGSDCTTRRHRRGLRLAGRPHRGGPASHRGTAGALRVWAEARGRAGGLAARMRPAPGGPVATRGGRPCFARAEPVPVPGMRAPARSRGGGAGRASAGGLHDPVNTSHRSGYNPMFGSH